MTINLIRDNIPDIRFLYDLKEVLYDQNWLRRAFNFETYYMYRNLAQNEQDAKTIIEANLRYDITVIPSQMFGAEFPKTLGHEHAKIQNIDITYTEIYEVLKGEAYYLLQKHKNGIILDAYTIHAKTGEKCIIPPNYGHITINAADKELVMANWVEKNFKSDYSLFKNNRGACYYALSPAIITREQVRLADEQKIHWLKNENYSNTPELKIFKAKEFNYLLEKFSINPDEPMYNLINNINKLDFLKNPQKYAWDR